MTTPDAPQNVKIDPDTIYRTGHNLPGCLPDSDPYATLDWAEAQDVLIEELERVCDEFEEEADLEEADLEEDRIQVADSLKAARCSLKDLLNAKPGDDFQACIRGRLYWLESGEPIGDEEARRAALAVQESVELDDVEAATYGDNAFEIGSSEFLVLTDDEADWAADEYIYESVWAFDPEWIADFVPDGISAGDIETMRGDSCEDFNEPATALIEAGRGMYEFIRASIGAEGRGHFLSNYDGKENESGDFYIYQVN